MDINLLSKRDLIKVIANMQNLLNGTTISEEELSIINDLGNQSNVSLGDDLRITYLKKPLDGMLEYSGEIEMLPPRVVELMLVRQVEQGNEADVSVFEKSKSADVNTGGFTWELTPEGHDAWSLAINKGDYRLLNID